MNKGLKPAIIILFGSICLLACSASPEEQITRVLDRRVQGLEQKDLALYMSTVSADYNDGENTYKDIEQKISGYFSTFEKIELSVRDRSIYINGDQARVVEKYILTFSFLSGKRTGSGEQLFTLRMGDNGWKITSGLGKQ